MLYHITGEVITTNIGQQTIWAPATIFDFATLFPGVLGVGTPMEMLSTSVVDTGHKIRVYGLDPDGVHQSKVFTTSGTTPVAIGNWYRIYRLETDAETFPIFGVIRTRDVAASGVNAELTKVFNCSTQCVFTIPSNTNGGAIRTVSLLNDPTVLNIELKVEIIKPGGPIVVPFRLSTIESPQQYEIGLGAKTAFAGPQGEILPPLTDIQLTTFDGAGGAVIHASMVIET